MRTGSVAVQRGGRTYLAERGDGILVPAGECDVAFLQCPNALGVQAEILEFDHRTLAPKLRAFPDWETLAFDIDDPAAGAIPLAGFAKNMCLVLDNQPPNRPRYPAIMGELFGQFRRGLPQFLKELFYLPRWRLFGLIERSLQLPNGLAHLGANYPGGEKQLRKDCRLYLGADPATIVTRRRCELATAWLRCGHSIDEVGKALGYSSRWEFESAYSGRMRKACAAVQRMPPLETLPAEELIDAIRPYWWPRAWPARVSIPPTPDESEFQSEVQGDQQEALERGPEMEEQQERGIVEDLNSRRAAAAAALRESAKDFFAMKSTGADMIVPIFGQPEIMELLAA